MDVNLVQVLMKITTKRKWKKKEEEEEVNEEECHAQTELN